MTGPHECLVSPGVGEFPIMLLEFAKQKNKMQTKRIESSLDLDLDLAKDNDKDVTHLGFFLKI